MNAEFAIPNCVRYIIFAYLDAKGEIWLPYEKQLEQGRDPVWKYAFFQQGCRTCPLCIFQERKARKIPNSISSWAEHWSIGQSFPYCKERPFSERNPQLLSTATIATILNFILLRGLWSRSEPEQQFSDAKVSYHLKTTIFFGSKFPKSGMIFVFSWWGPAETDQQPTEKQQIFRTWKSQQQNLPQAFVYPTFCWQT